ncbi:hypothetical protein AB0A86_32440 [Streptomyces chrestomyceticus]
MASPILLVLTWVNHILPLGPVVICSGRAPAVGTGYSVMAPAGVILPIWTSWGWVNQTLPSGPAAMP